MAEFWEESFQAKGLMWGEEPARSTLFAADYLRSRGAHTVLIPGFGYGRNALPFIKAGMTVSGIEISRTAIVAGERLLGPEIVIHHGSVAEMPFDSSMFDGVFCHALIHLLDESHRVKLLGDCFAQLHPGGTMIFTAISKLSPSFGQGRKVDEDRYEQHGGVKICFFDMAAAEREFANYGLVKVAEIAEDNRMNFIVAICHKPEA